VTISPCYRAGCVGLPTGTSTPSTPPIATATAAGSAASPAATAASTPRPTAGSAQVDLTFTGTHQFTAKGSAGRCSLGTPAGGGLVLFGFEATEADYPGLSKSFSLLTFGQNPEYVDLKWVLDNGGYGRPDNPPDPADLTLSADHHTVALDVDLDQFGPQGGPMPGPEHVSGAITCP